MLAKGADFLREIDPSPDLGQKFHREHTQLIKRYEELYKKLTNNQKQPLITQFVKNVKNKTEF
jgi:rubrerythrin